MRLLALSFALLLVACSTEEAVVAETTPRPSGQGGKGNVGGAPGSAGSAAGMAPQGGSSPGGAHGGAVSSAGSPALPCDPRFTLSPDPPLSASPLDVRFTDAPGYVWVDLTASSAQGSPAVQFVGVSGGSPHTWTYRLTGLPQGLLSLRFTADMGKTLLGTCERQVREGAGGAEGVAGAAGAAGAGGSTACVPSCTGVRCGGDDGCGAPCEGAHREELGLSNDCRAGDCGCGVAPNGNMQCLSQGRCRVRCSCDCLPPVDVDAAEVEGKDFGASCLYVFEKSGDPTVFDQAKGEALCPLDHDPQGEARCSECPPCHRNPAPECPLEAYCTCRDPRWVDDYRATCCAAGPSTCF